MPRDNSRYSYPRNTPGRRCYYTTKPGRVRIKLAKLLREMGYEIEPEQLEEAQGYYRIYAYDDSISWGARCKTGTAKWTDRNGVKHDHWQDETNIHSWSTMSDCIKYGIVALPQDSANESTEICANH